MSCYPGGRELMLDLWRIDVLEAATHRVFAGDMIIVTARDQQWVDFYTPKLVAARKRLAAAEARIAELTGKCQACNGDAGFVSSGDGWEEWDECKECLGTGRRDTAIAQLQARIAELERERDEALMLTESCSSLKDMAAACVEAAARIAVLETALGEVS